MDREPPRGARVGKGWAAGGNTENIGLLAPREGCRTGGRGAIEALVLTIDAASGLICRTGLLVEGTKRPIFSISPGNCNFGR